MSFVFEYPYSTNTLDDVGDITLNVTEVFVGLPKNCVIELDVAANRREKDEREIAENMVEKINARLVSSFLILLQLTVEILLGC